MKRMAALLVLLVPVTARAEDTAAARDAAFRRGNDAYYRGQYAEAVTAYEQVALLGIKSEDLYFNLGNAYYKAGQLGPAIYNYERALELDPGQEDVEYNLRVAREAVKKKGEDRLLGSIGPSFWIRAVQPYTVGGLGWLFLSLYVTVFGLLVALHFSAPGFLRAGLWVAFAFLMLGTVASGLFYAGRRYLAERVKEAVVLPDTVAVKDGPVMSGADEATYTTVFRVHAGLRVRVTESDQDWVRVRLANGLEGWIRDRDLGRL